MTDREHLNPAVVDAFREQYALAVRRLVECTRRDPSDPPDYNPVVVWRPQSVTNPATQRMIMSSSERLVRWDTRGPDDIFANGFRPQADRPDPIVDIAELPENQLNLNRYVRFYNVEPGARNFVFVGTGRYVRVNGQPHRYQPRRRAINYEYEIFAYGGIDVNLSLGNSHQFAYQNEIAFPGGIRPEFIRSVREYRGDTPADVPRELVNIYRNTQFNIRLNPENQRPAESIMPPIAGSSGPRGMRPIDWPVCQCESDRIATVRSERLVDPMREDGSLVADEDDNIADPSYLRAIPVDPMREPGDLSAENTTESDFDPPNPARAALADWRTPEEAWIFAENRFVRIRIKPGTTDDYIVSGPNIIYEYWDPLRQVGFGTVDALYDLRRDGKPWNRYFFRGSEYTSAWFDAQSNRLGYYDSPKSIVDKWPSLKQVGFTTVDTIIPSPEGPGYAYFFRGTQYAYIYINPDNGDDSVIGGPKSIVDNWPSLAQANFPTLDNAFKSPADPNQFYVFRGIEYALIEIWPGTTDDKLINGPKAVHTNWPSLTQASFY